jgi:hypothetical protein
VDRDPQPLIRLRDSLFFVFGVGRTILADGNMKSRDALGKEQCLGPGVEPEDMSKAVMTGRFLIEVLMAK